MGNTHQAFLNHLEKTMVPKECCGLSAPPQHKTTGRTETTQRQGSNPH